MKIIYDVGAFNGDDLQYYLLKADLVVAIEPNPTLAGSISERFKSEIASGGLKVECCVATAHESSESVPFYVHRNQPYLSQFPLPPAWELDNFDKIQVNSKSLVSIIREHGSPYFIKIDVERYDKILLKSVFDNGIFPPYMSAEAHEVETFTHFVSIGGYKAFKLVDGITVSEVYKNHQIATDSGPSEYSFPYNAAGPFGNDINGPWLTAASLFKTLSSVGLGWKDIHVSNVDNPQQ